MINLLYAGNYKVFDNLLLSLMSIKKHTNEALNVYLLTADLQEINKEYKPIDQKHVVFLENYLKQKNKNSSVQRIILGDDFKKWILKSQNGKNSYTPFAMLRLFADKIKELPDKIIYLDCDIMALQNIKQLYDVDINNKQLGVVLDRYGRYFINRKYFNSGVLLMNMKKLREDNCFEKVRDMCLNKRMKFPDQTALNKCCRVRITLPRKFNEQGNPKSNTILQHFSNRIHWLPFYLIKIKQSNIEKVHNIYKIHNYDDIYEEFKNIKEKFDKGENNICQNSMLIA